MTFSLTFDQGMEIYRHVVFFTPAVVIGLWAFVRTVNHRLSK